MTAFSLQIPDELFNALVERLREELRREREERDEGFLSTRSAADFLDITEDALRSR